MFSSSHSPYQRLTHTHSFKAQTQKTYIHTPQAIPAPAGALSDDDDFGPPLPAFSPPAPPDEDDSGDDFAI